MKDSLPYQLWNAAVDMTGFGRKAAASDASAQLKRLRSELGAGFDAAFRFRMITARADSFEELIEDWINERTRLGV